MRRRVSDCWAANADAAAAAVEVAFSVLSYQVMQARFDEALYGLQNMHSSQGDF